jgi:FkbM family methyltransferase
MRRTLFQWYLAGQAAARQHGAMRWRPARKLSRSLYKRLRCGEELTLVCRGLTWRLPTRDPYFTASLVLEGTHEPFETLYFERWLRPGMTVVDVGAHVGWYALLAARRIGASGRVLALEPDAENCARLARHLSENGITNVRIVPQAAAAAAGEAWLQRDACNTGGHRLSGDRGAGAASRVETVALDALFAPGEARVDVIKMDVEGGELSVWQGMRRVLRESPDLRVMMEFSPAALEAAGTPGAALLAACRRDGFGVHYLHGESQRTRAIDLDELLAICRRGDGHTTVWLWRVA